MDMFRSNRFKLLLIGVFLMLVGVILMMAAFFVSDSDISTGTIIIIGPIPIILGSGPHAFFAIFLAVVLTILCLILFFFMRHLAKQTK